jgi:hypothetical protein
MAKRRKKAPPRAQKTYSISPFVVGGSLVFIILFVAFIRFRLLDFPLERDEGEYAYSGQLLLKGIPPYAKAYNMKLPGVYAAYALIMAVFGQTPAGIHLGLLIVNTATTVVEFIFARRLFGMFGGLIAAGTFAILSVSQPVLGTAAHATHFVILPAIGGIVLLVKAIESRSRLMLFFSGLLLGLAFVMKQPGAFFTVFGAVYFLWAYLKKRPIAWPSVMKMGAMFALGVVLPFGLTCLVLVKAGVFNTFWFWTFSYAREYASVIPISEAFNTFRQAVGHVARPALLLWALAGLGLIFVSLDKSFRDCVVFIWGFLFFSFLAICPGFYFREHYFILPLPAIGLLVGAAASAIRGKLAMKDVSAAAQFVIPTAVFLVAAGQFVFGQRAFFFDMTPNEACRMTYGTNPFIESLEIANYIKANSAKDDRIAVIGSEPQIYFYADRISATGYIYTYGLMEAQAYALKMQNEMISEIEANSPKYLIFVNVAASWLARRESEQRIFDWFDQYTKRNYDLVGIADKTSLSQTVYRWGEQVRAYSPKSTTFLVVYKQKLSG